VFSQREVGSQATDDVEGEMSSGPTDCLEGEETDEGGEWRIVCPPAVQESGGQSETLMCGEEGL